MQGVCGYRSKWLRNEHKKALRKIVVFDYRAASSKRCLQTEAEDERAVSGSTFAKYPSMASCAGCVVADFVPFRMRRSENGAEVDDFARLQSMIRQRSPKHACCRLSSSFTFVQKRRKRRMMRYAAYPQMNEASLNCTSGKVFLMRRLLGVCGLRRTQRVKGTSEPARTSSTNLRSDVDDLQQSLSRFSTCRLDALESVPDANRCLGGFRWLVHSSSFRRF